VKSFEERYNGEIPTDNTALDVCRQCKNCLFKNDGTVWTSHYQKGACAIYPYPESKPTDVMLNRETCEFYEKEV
jgi:hypothetical protein